MHSGYTLRATTFFPSDAPARAIPMSQRLTVDRLSETPNTMVAFRWMLGKWKHSGNGLKWKVQTMEICFSSLAVLVSLTECSVKSSLATRLAKYATTRSFSLPFRRIGGASHLTASSKTRYACIRHRSCAHRPPHECTHGCLCCLEKVEPVELCTVVVCNSLEFTCQCSCMLRACTKLLTFSSKTFCCSVFISARM